MKLRYPSFWVSVAIPMLPGRYGRIKEFEKAAALEGPSLFLSVFAVPFSRKLLPSFNGKMIGNLLP
ncbi:MAG: hypothetical protein WEA58_12840 [Balneolaceae bacterium]